ncbi:MAG: ATP-binding protein [Actinophytocola sp.]|nr:ATP-binding protein [Actinophytocola sp.]
MTHGGEGRERRHDDPEPSAPHTYHMQVPATGEQLIVTRRELRTWVDRLGVAQPTAQKIELASYEAMANVALHAYDGSGDGQLTLSATAHPDRLDISVSDSGQWREPSPRANPDGGMGITLIQRLAVRAHIKTDDDGTVVSMTWTTTP